MSVALSPATVQGGTSSTGTATLSGAAPAGGAVVTLSSNRATASAPLTVTILAATTSATFTVTTTATSADETATITASYAGIDRTATLAVLAPVVTSISVAPSSVQGGSSAMGTVGLTVAAPAGGVLVSLSSSSAFAIVPGSVAVAAGSTSAVFPVTTTAVDADATATITAAYGGASQAATLTITLQPPPPASLSSLSLAPASVQGGTSSTGTVALSGAAPSGGAVIALSSSTPSATVPASLAVAAGATSGTFVVATTTVASDATATVTASYAGVSRPAQLSITPPPPTLSAVSLSPTSVQGGAGSTGTVTLTKPALAGGMAVALTSSSAAAVVPSSTTVAAGSTSAAFTVTTLPVAVDETATITATLDGTARTATLTVTAPDPCALRTAGAQWLAFSSKRSATYDIYAMRDDGTCLTQVTSGAGDDLFVSWSPAGTLAYMSARSGRMQIYVRDFTTGVERLLDVGDLTATSPAFSPDGLQVAFEGYAPGVTAIADIYVVPAAGGPPVKLTSSQKYSAGPAWSPDGATIYFVSNRVSGYNVWSVPTAGGAETMIPGTAGILGRPAATPDGLRLAYTLSASGAAFSQVVIQTLGTGAIRMVTNQKDAEPAFNRSGDRMVVTSQRGSGADLLLLDTATGAVVRQLTTDPSIDGLGAYGPFP